ncbi:hypothetical protein C1H46_006530 [Malus baccata]|uniref:Uncharacterized protein n=1 Tax=Malus baccata TaxID=106549 RepID=A0A540NA02_MALBA|nr:hypothetical protein C1H46_006530 [Malus baccata]
MQRRILNPRIEDSDRYGNREAALATWGKQSAIGDDLIQHAWDKSPIFSTNQSNPRVVLFNGRFRRRKTKLNLKSKGGVGIRRNVPSLEIGIAEWLLVDPNSKSSEPDGRNAGDLIGRWWFRRSTRDERESVCEYGSGGRIIMEKMKNKKSSKQQKWE